MVEGADSKRDLANRTSSRGCCGLGYGNQSQHHSLRGCPGADTYDNRSPLSLTKSQPYSHRHACSYAYAYPRADANAHTGPHAGADANADTHAHSYAHAHPYARLQRRTIPKLGMAILR